jgi:ASC-1-like (ASCH) protein
MAVIKVTASLNTKLKFFSEFENINPHASITIEEEVPDSWTDEQRLERASELYDKARKVVEKKIESDIKSAKGDKAKKIG